VQGRIDSPTSKQITLKTVIQEAQELKGAQMFLLLEL